MENPDGKDAALVGICLDAAESLDQCKQLLAETKVDYLNLLPYQNMMTDLGIEAIPSSLFVDREGKILLPMVVGVPRDVSAYEKLIDGLLAAVSPAEEATAEEAQASDAAQDAYRVKVVDENGTPLPGAMVQFCGTTFCSVLFTDENGVAAFQGVEERQPYTVHLLKAPEGYEGTDEEFTAPATYGDITIVLKKAS